MKPRTWQATQVASPTPPAILSWGATGLHHESALLRPSLGRDHLKRRLDEAAPLGTSRCLAVPRARVNCSEAQPDSRALGRRLKRPTPSTIPAHVYEVRPRKDHRGVDLSGKA